MPNGFLKQVSTFVTIAMFTALGAGTSLTAYAQVDPKAQSFDFRARSSSGFNDITVDPFMYRGEPVKFKTFLLFPNLTLEQAYNDNVLATETQEKSDFVTALKPELLILKKWGRHQFLAALNAEIFHHWDLKNENVENYSATIDVDLEAKQGLNIPVRLSYHDGSLQRRNQRRASVSELTEKPLGVKSLEAETGFIYKPNRLMLSMLGSYRQARLENARIVSGGQLVRDNGDVDRMRIKARASYDAQTGWAPFLETTFAQEEYINQAPGSLNRNNDLLRVLTGTSFDFKGLLYGFVGAGWENRSYDSGAIDDAGGLSVEAMATWEPSTKSRIIFDVSRKTSEDNEIVAALTKTYAGVEFRHELQRSLFLKTSVSHEREEFESTSREDDTIDAGVGINYIIGPHLQLSAEYDYVTRDSTVNGLSMENSIVFLRAKTAW